LDKIKDQKGKPEGEKRCPKEKAESEREEGFLV